MTKQNPFVEPPKGMGRSRWRQTTRCRRARRRAYIKEQKAKYGWWEPLPEVRSNNNAEELKPIPFPLTFNGKTQFNFKTSRKNGFVVRFRKQIYSNQVPATQ